MDEELEKMFDLMDKHLRPESEVHTAVINFKKLMRMHYEYTKAVFKEMEAKGKNERTGCF